MPWSKLSRDQANALYLDVHASRDTAAMRRLCQYDLFYLLTRACRRRDINRDWLYQRCREVETKPNGMLDLWAREHYKSTVITFGKTIQDILANPDITVGIFAHTRPIAKSFLSQIKRELESNEFLKQLFPDALYNAPAKESPKWSLDGGIVVKRKSNPKEATIEAWGLVDGQPTSKHFSLLVYDDVVTLESVTTPEQIEKTTNAWAMSLNLGAQGGARRYIGTRYHFNDTYKTILEREAATPRIYPATHNGKLEGNPVLLTRQENDEKRQQMGPYVYSSQMLLDPVADRAMGFKREWLRHYDVLRNTGSWNKYVLVDPASKKKKTSDYTVVLCIGIGLDNNYYLMDAYRDRMNLTERTRKVFEFVRKHRPVAVGYESYGLQADIEHIQYVQEQENYRFKIVELGGTVSKEDRIRRLVPVFEQGRFYLPPSLLFVDHERKAHDFVREFIDDEYLAFPVAIHDDMLDAMARIVDSDFGARAPEPQKLEVPSHTMLNSCDTLDNDYDVLG